MEETCSHSIDIFTLDLGQLGEAQGHAQFECEYHVNGDRYGKHSYCHQIESGIRPFYWHIDIVSCLIIKVKIKVIHLSNANNSETKTYRTYIAIAKIYDDIYIWPFDWHIYV